MTIYCIYDYGLFLTYRTNINDAIAYADSLKDKVYTDNPETIKKLRHNFAVAEENRFKIVPMDSEFNFDEIQKKYYAYVNPESHELLDISMDLPDVGELSDWEDVATEDECGIYEFIYLGYTFTDALATIKRLYREETGRMLVVDETVPYCKSYREIIMEKLDALGVRYATTLSTEELYNLLIANGDDGVI